MMSVASIALLAAGAACGQPSVRVAPEDLPEVCALRAPGAQVETAVAGSNGWVAIDYVKDIEKGSALDFSNWGILDAPAGKYGRVVARNGHFEFEKRPGVRQRFYGANVCLGALFQADAEIDRMLVRFERLGYNTFRIHHYDQEVRQAATPQEIGQLGRLDRLIAEAGKRGFYLAIDLYTLREPKWTDCGIDRPGRISYDLYKELIAVHEGAYLDWERFARRMLTHRNPHNGLTWAEDPAIAFLDLINEGARPLSHFMTDRRLACEPLLLAAWDKWLAAKRRANPAYAPQAEFGAWPHRHCDEAAVAFASELQDRVAARQTALVRELGYRGVVTSDNLPGHDFVPMQKVALARYDCRDCHFYHDHCQAVGDRPQTSLPQRYPRTSPFVELDLWMTRIAYERLPQMPFTVTEFSFPIPSPHRASGTMMTGALAALQDWDGLWQFAYSHRPLSKCDAVPGSYDIARDVLNQMAERINIALFLRGDMKSTTEGVCLDLADVEDRAHPHGRAWSAWPEAKIGDWSWGDAAWKTRVASSFGEAPGWRMLPRSKAERPSGMTVLEDLQENPQMRIVRAPDDNPHFELATPRTCAGNSSRHRDLVTVGPLSFRIGGYAASTVACTSTDGAPLAESKRILLLQLTDAIGEGARWVRAQPTGVMGGRTVGSIVLLTWGKGATLVKNGNADIDLALTDPAGYSVWVLSTSGRRLEKLAAKVENGRLRFRTQVQGSDGKGRLAYEIVKD